MDAAAEIARRTLTERAKEQHRMLAEASHTAALAADRLQAAAVGQGDGKAEIRSADLAAIIAMMRDVQNKARLAFLSAHGTEADRQAAARRVGRLYKAPRVRKGHA